MDIEKLISEATKDKASKLDIEMPSFENIWSEAKKQNSFTAKRKKRRDFALGKLLRIAVALLIILVTPFAAIKLRDLNAGPISPPSMQNSLMSQHDLIEAKKVANDFLAEFYKVEDYTKVDEYGLLYPNDPRTKRLKQYSTDNYYINKLTANSDYSLYLLAVAKWTGTNFSLEDASLMKYAEDDINKSITFTSEAVLKCILKDGSEERGYYRGQITVEKDNGAWKVANYTETSYEPKEMFDKSYISINTINVSRIVEDFLPHVYNPVIHQDSLEYKGKWKGSILPEFEVQMEKIGWKLYTGMGAKKYYKNQIDGKEVRISILPKEQGGPEEKNAVTLIIVNIEY